MATTKNKTILVKYTGKNPSYTVENTRFDKKNNIKMIDAKLASIILKYDCFEEVKEDAKSAAAKKKENDPGETEPIKEEGE
jgi:hypothetical protein